MGGLSLGPQASQQQASQQQLAMQMGLNSMLQMQGAGGPAGQMLANQQPHIPGLPHQGGHMDLLHQQQAQQEMLLLRQQHLAHQMGMAGAQQVTVDAPCLLSCMQAERRLPPAFARLLQHTWCTAGKLVPWPALAGSACAG